jgi:uncharacterized protein YjbJ (UPF0337 family)
MGEDPEAIRQDIRETRDEMGQTVDALGYKADVKSRAKESVASKTGDVKNAGRRVASTAEENPLGLAIGGIAVGFLAGVMIPSTRVESEKIGPAADQVKGQIKETASEAVDRGKQVAQEAAQSAQETAKQSGQQDAESLAPGARPSN